MGRTTSKRRPRVRRRTALILAGTALAAAGGVLVADRTLASRAQADCPLPASRSSQSGLQRALDGLVAGPSPLAPGATASVSGPKGSRSAAAGVADTGSCEPMTPSTRLRLESVSKIYTATLILQLAQEGKLRLGDSLGRWLPGLLPHAEQATIRQLLTMTSGLIDNNDMDDPADAPGLLARVKDPRERVQLAATLKRRQEHPEGVASPMFWIRLAAWQPLLYQPGAYHYSNIGYEVLGLVAEKAGGRPLQALYEQRIFRPLGLRATAYDPQGAIRGQHAHGYGIEPDGRRTDATDWHFGVGGAEGGIVASAQDTATFLTALMQGKLLDRRWLEAMKGDALWNGGAGTVCDEAYGWSGGGSGFKSEVWVNGDGSRVAVLLLNARHWDTAQAAADRAASDAMARLYCAA